MKDKDDDPTDRPDRNDGGSLRPSGAIPRTERLRRTVDRDPSVEEVDSWHHGIPPRR